MFLAAEQLNYDILYRSVKLNQDSPGLDCEKLVIYQLKFTCAVISLEEPPAWTRWDYSLHDRDWEMPQIAKFCI